MADSTMVARAIVGAISAQSPYLNAQMASVGDYQIKALMDYFNPSPAASMYPLIMLQHVRETNSWHSMPNIYGTMFEFEVIGLVNGMEPETIDHTVQKMAAAVKQILGSRHTSLQLEDGNRPVYVEPGQPGRPFFPVTGIQYIESYVGETITRGFRLRHKCTVIEAITDELAYANSLQSQGNQV